jgi:hypothetical protein
MGQDDVLERRRKSLEEEIFHTESKRQLKNTAGDTQVGDVSG